MLNISKNQVVVGQPVVFNLNVDFDFEKIKEAYDKSVKEIGYNWSNSIQTNYYSKRTLLRIITEFTSRGFKDGDTVFLQKVSGTTVTFKDNTGKEHHSWWSEFKTCTSIPAGEENLGSEKVEYVIYLNGKKYKQKKFSDLGKVKASLLVMMDYHGLFYNKSQKHLDTCPEYKYGVVSEWLECSGDDLTRDDFSKVEVFEWKNRKLGNKADIDPLKFYDEQMFLINVSSKYGSCVREIYKKMEDNHKYIFVFVHEDYKNSWCDYKELKESELIKKAMKDAKIKGSLKATKMGKTAISVQTATDAANIIHHLPQDSKYYILDINGNELALLDNWFVLAESRDERIAEIFAD
jgi:hypothetical protein